MPRIFYNPLRDKRCGRVVFHALNLRRIVFLIKLGFVLVLLLWFFVGLGLFGGFLSLFWWGVLLFVCLWGFYTF